MKVKMIPHLSHFRSEQSGIRTVVTKYFQHLPKFGIELVDPKAESYDLVAAHAGSTGAECSVAHLHGIYFTADYQAAAWEYDVNARIVEAIRSAKEITVPSSWVAETFQRDLRVSPHVIGHGVDWEEWQHNEECQGHIIGYAKNRVGDVCDPEFLTQLARRFPDKIFTTSFAPKERPDNVKIAEVMPHEQFKPFLQRAAVYISPAKETWGVATIEAMAAGIPVLGWAHGGNLDLVQHGINGYLAKPGDIDDLAEGLNYCLKFQQVLGKNGQELAKRWTWEAAAQRVAEVYELALRDEPASVSVVIPVYNKSIEQVTRAIDSCLAQTYQPEQVIIVNDGSSNSKELQDFLSDFEHNTNVRVGYIEQSNQGVANARNNGIAQTGSKYVCCLDADDWIQPTFLEACVAALEADRSLGIAYTGLWYVKPDGSEGLSPWPGEWNYDKQLQGQNQVPTCNVMRRIVWERLGGQRQRYAPSGAGEEDAEMWLRAGAYGWKAEKVSDEGLFVYSWLSGQVSGSKEHQVTDYKAWHPWTRDDQHPFATYATPRKFSHPVRQYDEPTVSIIIPVGPGHEKSVIDALDSLEGQTFRKWEAIIVSDVFDTADPHGWLDRLRVAYPYIRDGFTGGDKGAGFARNWGASMARAPFLLFLDADDTLHPDALDTLLEGWNRYQTAVYSDYVGQAFIEPQLAGQLEKQNRLEYYNNKTGEAIIKYKSFDFDCARALRQPDPNDLYIWNLITTLIPKAWHVEIGGFDEKMDTWEDWDYWIRLAQAGRCFTRIERPLVRYRFYSGERRSRANADTEEGRQKARTMIQYLRHKYAGVETTMGCNCSGKNNGGQPPAATLAMNGGAGEMLMMADSDFVRARYIGPKGAHQVIGAARFGHQIPNFPMQNVGNNQFVIRYGRLSDGAIRLVHKEDVRLMPQEWQAIAEKPVEPEVARQVPAAPTPIFEGFDNQIKATYKDAPSLVGFGPAPAFEPETTVRVGNVTIENVGNLDLNTLPGVTPAIAQQLKAKGWTTQEAILQADVEGLTSLEGVAEKRAKGILRALQD